MLVQATSGGGGWPMSVFLTPELQPFLGGTYFPPSDAYGQPGEGPPLMQSRHNCTYHRIDAFAQGCWARQAACMAPRHAAST